MAHPLGRSFRVWSNSTLPHAPDDANEGKSATPPSCSVAALRPCLADRGAHVSGRLFIAAFLVTLEIIEYSCDPHVDGECPMTTEPEVVARSMLPQPCQLVIFGAPGDLSWRKLLPAVYNLNVDGVLPSHFAVVGFGLPAEGDVKGDPDEWMPTAPATASAASRAGPRRRPLGGLRPRPFLRARQLQRRRRLRPA